MEIARQGQNAINTPLYHRSHKRLNEGSCLSSFGIPVRLIKHPTRIVTVGASKKDVFVSLEFLVGHMDFVVS